MKIFIFGGAATGKSTLIRELTERTGLNAVAIDSFREKEERNGRGGEKAKAAFLKKIEKAEACIIEASGFGRLGFSIRTLAVQEKNALFVLLKTPENIRLQRLAGRTKNFFGKYSRSPPPNGEIRNFYSRYNYLELTNARPHDIKTNTEKIIEAYGKIQSCRTDQTPLHHRGL